MKIAVFTVGTPDLTVETLPGQLKHYGYNGVEWRVAERPAAAPQPLPDRSQWYWTYNQATLNLAAIEAEAQHAKELCDGVGLEIVCLSTYLTPDKLDEIERVMRAAQAIHCPKMRVMAPGYRGDTSYVQLFDATQRYLADAAALAEKHKIKLILEIHHRNIIPSASAAYRLVSPFPAGSVGVIYDPGNMVHEGFEQYRLGVELLGEYLDHVHIKDARPQYSPEQGRWTIEWCSVGDGMVDFPELVRALRSAGYTGWLSIEDFSNERDTAGKLAHNIKYLLELLNA